jgi:ribosome-binding protein aMBF1 (putative translation factor)
MVEMMIEPDPPIPFEDETFLETLNAVGEYDKVAERPMRPPMNAKQLRAAQRVINGDVVRNRRKALGMTQIELGIRAATTSRVIASIERNRTLDPPTSTTLRLAKALSITVEALCAGAQPYTSRTATKPRDRHSYPTQ